MVGPPSSTRPSSTSSDQNDLSARQFLRDSDSTNDIKTVRALLLAIARHYSIEIPKESSPLGITTSYIDPQNSRYDEDATVDYHVRQLQDPDDLTRRSDAWRSSPPAIRLDVAPNMRQQPEPGLTLALSWPIDQHLLLRDGIIQYNEFGFDAKGYLCDLEQDERGIAGEAAPPMNLINVPNTGSTDMSLPRSRRREPRELNEHIVGSSSLQRRDRESISLHAQLRNKTN